MKKVLVTGANGQLGAALRQCTVGMDGFAFFFTDIDTLDICDRSQMDDFIRLHHVDVIINCAAYTAVDRAEDEPELCARINCDAVRSIGEIAASVHACVIHISTDYVFDGCIRIENLPADHRSAASHPADHLPAANLPATSHPTAMRPYRETDVPHPISVYGKTKLAGEQALSATCRNSIILRTAWLYSETGMNFVKTMLRLGRERDTVDIVADQHGTPTYAGDLAEVIKTILAADSFTPGVYHYTNAGVCTWYDFAVKIFELTGICCKANPITTLAYPTRAVRPSYSVLDKTKIIETYAVQIPVWEASLAKCLRSLAPGMQVSSLQTPVYIN